MVVDPDVQLRLVIYRLPLLRARNELDSWVSREAAFLVNNWILLFCAFFVCFATMFPTLSEAVTGERITVGPPFFNQWMLPIGLTLLADRHRAAAGLAQVDAGQPARSVPVARACRPAGRRRLVALGVRVWSSGLCFALCGFVIGTIVQEFWRGARAPRARPGPTS